MKTQLFPRYVQETRTMPVRELTPEECRKLLVHSHETGSPMRHKAYLLRSAGENWSAYFNGTEASKIQAWIENEPSHDCLLCKQPAFGGEKTHHKCP